MRSQKKPMKQNESILRRLIKRNAIREKRLFSDGYQEIYRRVLAQIESLIRNHPVLTEGTIVVPTYAIGTIIISNEEAIKYVKRQLLKEGIHVIGQNAKDHTILVTWMATTTQPVISTTKTKSINSFSGKNKQTSIVLSSSSCSSCSSSASSSNASSPTPKSSSSSSLSIVPQPRGQQQMSMATAPPPLKLVNKIPDIVSSSSNHTKKQPLSSSSNNTKKATTTTTTSSNSKKSQSKLSSKDEAKLARLHTGVLRAATAC